MAVAASAVVGSASAAPVYGTLVAPTNYTGTRTLNVNELEAGGAAGITTLNLSWNIGYNLGLWNYSYTMNWTPSGAQGISHIIFDLSDNCTSAASNCVINPKVSTGTNASVNPAGVSYSTFNGTQTSNPGMGGPITGVKFDMPDDPDFKTPFSVTFSSERAPMWGDFYTKAGNITNAGWYSQNVGIDNHASTNILNFIAVPDTVSQPQCPNGAPNWPVCSEQNIETPEPMSMAMLGAGLLGLAGIRVRRRRAQA